MPDRVRRSVRLGVLALAVLVAACSPDASADVGAGRGPATVDTLLTTESALIGQISDIAVGGDGAVYLADRLNHSIHVVPSSGEAVRTFGRQGSGPAELNGPTGVLVSGDTLIVVDFGNNRIQLLGLGGDPFATRPLPGGYTPAVSPSGWIVRSTLTADTTLAAIHRPDLEVHAHVGRIIGTPTRTVSMKQIREDIQRGVVPQILLNSAEAVWAGDDSFWLLVPARGTVERYERSGQQRWSIALTDPAFASVKEDNARRNAESERGIVPLRYVLTARAVGDELWLLLGQSAFGPAVIQVLGADGSVGRRMTFSDVRDVASFAVDVTHGFAYFTTADTAELLRASLASAH